MNIHKLIFRVFPNSNLFDDDAECLVPHGLGEIDVVKRILDPSIWFFLDTTTILAAGSLMPLSGSNSWCPIWIMKGKLNYRNFHKNHATVEILKTASDIDSIGASSGKIGMSPFPNKPACLTSRS